jgi:DNA repair protein RecO (recombination protein O)
MQRWRTEAVLLRAVDFGESDRIVHLLTPGGGRLTAIAKGARRSVKRFPGCLDLFNHLLVRVERRRKTSMARLDGARLKSPFLGLREVPTRFALAGALVEVLDRMAPEGAAPGEALGLFRFTLAALRALERAQPDQRLRLLLELRTFAALGLQPELRRCVGCGCTPEDALLSFSIADGGVMCGACSMRHDGLLEVHLGTLRALERSLDFPLDQLDRLSLPPQALAEAGRLIGRFQRFHVGIELRSELLVNALIGSPRGGSAA